MATAAAFPVAYGTSHVALTYRSHLKSGEVFGAWCRWRRRPDGGGARQGDGRHRNRHRGHRRESRAKSYGADYGINYSNEDIREKVLEYTGGADVIYDPVGGDAFKASGINFEGRIIIIGFASGEIPADSDELSTGEVFYRRRIRLGRPYHRNKVEVIHEGYAGLGDLGEGRLEAAYQPSVPAGRGGRSDARIVGAEIDRKGGCRSPVGQSASIVT